MSAILKLLEAFSANRTYAFYIFRMVSKGADMGECMRIGSMTSTPDEWFTNWHKAANTWEGRAQEALAKGHWATARDAFLLASFYYRAAEFFLAEEDDRKVPAYMKNNECFEKAGPFFYPPLDRVEIPYEGNTLPGYLYLPVDRKKRVPAAVFLGGADDCKEEHHYSGPLDLLARGVASLTFDGPGKGETLRLKRIYTLPDFERVSSAVIDFLETRPEVDSGRIGVVGISMGGYYSARAAALDDRVKACISLSGLYDVGEGLFDPFPPIREQLRYILGARDLAQAREMLREFSLKGCVKKIKCPYLIIHGSDDFLIPVAQAYKVFEEAECPKEIKIWPGGLHNCNDYLAELRAFIWDWLADKLSEGKGEK